MTFPQLTDLIRRASASTIFLRVKAATVTIAFFMFAVLNRIVPCKTRHILTRHNRLRLRYVVSACVVLIALGVMNMNDVARVDYMADGASDEDVAYIDPSAGAADGLAVYRDGEGQIRRDQAAKESAALVSGDNKVANTGPVDVSVEVGRGDTFTGVLVDAGVTTEEAHTLVSEVSQHFNMKRLHAGQ